MEGKSIMKHGFSAALALSAALAGAQAQAAPTTFFGEDIGLGENTVLGATPNADAAQASFLGSLINPGVETFEGIASGTSGPLGITFGNGVTANLNGNGLVQALADGTTNGFGRYGITDDADDDERFWEANGDGFTITFSEAISAFGFYGIDIGDFDGQVTATTVGGLDMTFNVGNSIGISGGSVMFWGVVDPLLSFTSVTFGNTGSGDDYFGFDDFTIGLAEQVITTPVPVPATLALMTLGLIGVRRFSRRQ